MDPRRFDAMTRSLGARISRRGALRAGAGAALAAIAFDRLAPVRAQNPDTGYKDRFISIRTYPYTGSIADAKTALKELLVLMQQQPGFIDLAFIDGDDEIHMVSTFLDKASAVAAAKQADGWIADNASEILSGKPKIDSGNVFLRSEMGTGCGCTTGVEHPCNTDRLICCPTTGILDGGPGVCLTAQTTCPAVAAAPAPTAAPVEPTAPPACTGEGCDCTAGAENTCDAGLQCCGADLPGGTGTCLAQCSSGCTGEGCACIAGTDGACDAGLECCGSGPGSEGVCQTACACTGEGCACTTGVDGACDAGLVCCSNGAAEPGASGTCTATCGPVDPCPGGEGCACTTGTDGACNDGLVCCGGSEPGSEGTCQSGCG